MNHSKMLSSASRKVATMQRKAAAAVVSCGGARTLSSRSAGARRPECCYRAGGSRCLWPQQRHDFSSRAGLSIAAAAAAPSSSLSASHFLLNHTAPPPECYSSFGIASQASALAAGLRLQSHRGNKNNYGGGENGGSCSNSSASWGRHAAMAACGGLGAVLFSGEHGKERRDATKCDAPSSDRPEERDAKGASEEGADAEPSSFAEKKEKEREERHGQQEEGNTQILAASVSHEFHSAYQGLNGGAIVLARNQASSNKHDDRTSLELNASDSLSDFNASPGEEDDVLAEASVNAATIARNSHNFKVLAAMEMRDELQKVELARLLQELHSLAKESSSFSDSASAAAASSLESSTSPSDDTDASVASPKNDEKSNKEGKILSFCPKTDRLTPSETTELIASLRNGGRFDRQSLSKILAASHKMLHREPSLIDLRGRGTGKVTVAGDLHGSIRCLTDVLDLVSRDLEEGNAVVFNGDFVDRGEHSLEVILTLLLLKLSHPDQVYLCRGNHEDSFLSAVYGFEDELRAKYGESGFDVLWGTFSNIFSALPLCIRTETAVIMHGGLPHDDFDLSEVEKVTVDQRCRIRSTLEPQNDVDRLLQGLLWSDPCPDIDGFRPNDTRGAGQLFGPDVARRFLDRHGLRYVVRSHEVTEQGWEAMDCGDGRYVLTVFSTAAYPNGEGFNKGAILRLQRDGVVKPEQFSRSNQLPNGHLTESSLNAVVEMIAANRGLLSEAFEGISDEDASASGNVTREQWASVMASALNLPDLDWMALQPSLAPTTCETSKEDDSLQDTGLVDWRRFLELHSVSLSSDADNDTCGCDDDDLQALYANHAMLLTVFKFLDTDGNGRVDPDEFRAGVRMLNERLPEGRRLGDPDRLFGVLDLDGNGEIELDEFAEVFKVI